MTIKSKSLISLCFLFLCIYCGDLNALDKDGSQNAFNRATKQKLIVFIGKKISVDSF